MTTSTLRLNDIYNLEGRVALVTGGGSGIGFMIAQGLATNGAKVYISGRRKETLDRAVSSLAQQNVTIFAVPMDVTDRESILNVKKVIEEKEGKLHILVNNAGQTGPVSPFFNEPSAPQRKDAETLGLALFNNESNKEWADHYSINTFSIFFVTTAFLGLLAKGSANQKDYTSCVINTTSVSGITKLAQNHFAYNSAKAAASHLTKMFATEFALKKIPVRVNAVAPGVYASEMTHAIIEGTEAVNKVGQGIQPVPADRSGTAVEVAGTAIYLASRAGCYTNGQEIMIDGGYLAVNPSTR